MLPTKPTSAWVLLVTFLFDSIRAQCPCMNKQSQSWNYGGFPGMAGNLENSQIKNAIFGGSGCCMGGCNCNGNNNNNLGGLGGGGGGGDNGGFTYGNGQINGFGNANLGSSGFPNLGSELPIPIPPGIAPNDRMAVIQPSKGFLGLNANHKRMRQR